MTLCLGGEYCICMSEKPARLSYLTVSPRSDESPFVGRRRLSVIAGSTYLQSGDVALRIPSTFENVRI